VHFTIYMYLYLYSYCRETARQLRMYAQLTRCFSAVAELLVKFITLRRDISFSPFLSGFAHLTCTQLHCSVDTGHSDDLLFRPHWKYMYCCIFV